MFTDIQQGLDRYKKSIRKFLEDGQFLKQINEEIESGELPFTDWTKLPEEQVDKLIFYQDYNKDTARSKLDGMSLALGLTSKENIKIWQDILQEFRN